MPRPPVDARLKNIEKSQKKILGILEKIADSKTNTDAPDDEESTPKVKAIECQCEKITVGSTDQENKDSGESQKHEDK